jgi:hypothetical protein
VGKQYPSVGNRENSPGATSVYIPRQQMTPGQTKYRTLNNNPVLFARKETRRAEERGKGINIAGHIEHHCGGIDINGCRYNGIQVFRQP